RRHLYIVRSMSDGQQSHHLRLDLHFVYTAERCGKSTSGVILSDPLTFIWKLQIRGPTRSEEGSANYHRGEHDVMGSCSERPLSVHICLPSGGPSAKKRFRVILGREKISFSLICQQLRFS